MSLELVFRVHFRVGTCHVINFSYTLLRNADFLSIDSHVECVFEYIVGNYNLLLYTLAIVIYYIRRCVILCKMKIWFFE